VLEIVRVVAWPGNVELKAIYHLSSEMQLLSACRVSEMTAHVSLARERGLEREAQADHQLGL
jgi:hypothetical protein